MTNIIRIKKAPTFPGEVYENLPPMLAELTEQFEDARSKDIILTGSMVVLSGCITGITGRYARDVVGPNLFGFIVAPAASGKGVVKFPMKLGNKIQQSITAGYQKEKANYDALRREWMKKARTDKELKEQPPTKPPRPVLYIPGNSSSAVIYKHLEESGGKGLICETESDTLSGAIRQDWGNFSHVLRGAFHHEPLSYSRKTDDTLYQIERPQLSVLLTGTPDQVPRLLLSTNDGLFSRFLFYCYDDGLEWQDQTPCDSCVNYDEFFEEMGLRVALIREALLKQPREFELSKEQFTALNAKFKGKLAELSMFDGQEASASVKRLSLITFRTAMLLSLLSNENQLDAEGPIICSEADFNTALLLAEVYYEHMLTMYSLLPRRSAEFSPQMREFYQLLPLDSPFPRKKADEIGKTVGISERSVGNYLERLIAKGRLSSPGYGKYLKPSEPPEPSEEQDGKVGNTDG